MGRLFWSFDRAMKSDCLAIVMAYQGQMELLRDLFGKSEGSDEGEAAAPAEKQNVSSRPLTPALFGALFARKGR